MNLLERPVRRTVFNGLFGSAKVGRFTWVSSDFLNVFLLNSNIINNTMLPYKISNMTYFALDKSCNNLASRSSSSSSWLVADLDNLNRLTWSRFDSNAYRTWWRWHWRSGDRDTNGLLSILIVETIIQCTCIPELLDRDFGTSCRARSGWATFLKLFDEVIAILFQQVELFLDLIRTCFPLLLLLCLTSQAALM